HHEVEVAARGRVAWDLHPRILGDLRGGCAQHNPAGATGLSLWREGHAGATRNHSHGNPSVERSTEENSMTIRLGDVAPDFEQDSSEGRISFHEWLGDSWGVLFSHPADFTPVCTTELGMTAKLKDEFAKRNTKVIALSVDAVDSHRKWIQDINDTQSTTVNFPIIADADRKVSELYDMIHPNASATATTRSLFVIAHSKNIR